MSTQTPTAEEIRQVMSRLESLCQSMPVDATYLLLPDGKAMTYGEFEHWDRLHLHGERPRPIGMVTL